MAIKLHSHAVARMHERGATEDEVKKTVASGEQFQAKFGRSGFRLNFPFGGEWQGKRYETKQIEAYTVPEDDDWLVITIIVKYF